MYVIWLSRYRVLMKELSFVIVTFVILVDRSLASPVVLGM